MIRSVAGLLVLVLWVAGCAAPTPNLLTPEPTLPVDPSTKQLRALYEKKFQLGSIEPFLLTLKDGVKLRGHVYLPNGTGPFAVVLEYSPYFNQQGSSTGNYVRVEDGFRTMSTRHRVFLEAGFAVALVNMRGTGTSQGCIQWGDPVDFADVTAVLDAVGTAPWSTGSVGMTGLSYPGWTQYMALAGGSKHLKAVLPTSGIPDLYSLVFRHGAPFFYEPVLIPERTTTTSYNTMFYPPNDPRWGEINRSECAARAAEDNAAFTKAAHDGDRTEYWIKRDLRDDLAKSHVPIFFTNGLTQGEGHILQFEDLWNMIPTPERRLLVGQWNHGFPVRPPVDFNLLSVAWLDHYLRGGPKLVRTGVVEYQDAQMGWHESDRWPPQGTDHVLHVSAGALTLYPDQVRASSQMFWSRDTNPCPGLCTDDYLPSRAAKIPNAPDCGPFQALYVSPPLASDVLLAGEFYVNITLTSTLPDGNVAAFLWHTAGRGACPDTGVVEVRRALGDLRHTQVGKEAADFPINTPTKVSLRSHPFATNVPAGHRLVLAIGGGSVELAPDQDKPVLTVTTGPGVMGQVTVRVVDGEFGFQG